MVAEGGNQPMGERKLSNEAQGNTMTHLPTCVVFFLVSCVYDSSTTKGVHTYTAEDFGGQVFIKLADDYSYVVVLEKKRREKSSPCH